MALDMIDNLFHAVFADQVVVDTIGNWLPFEIVKACVLSCWSPSWAHVICTWLMAAGFAEYFLDQD